MDVVQQLITVDAPQYLASLPVPGSVDELAALSVDDIIALAPLFTTILVVVISIITALKPAQPKKTTPSRINSDVELTSPKVATMVKKAELGEKVVYCRCWKSKKFPLCDGAHAKWNEATGDNIGPLVITA